MWRIWALLYLVGLGVLGFGVCVLGLGRVVWLVQRAFGADFVVFSS